MLQLKKNENEVFTLTSVRKKRKDHYVSISVEI